MKGHHMFHSEVRKIISELSSIPPLVWISEVRSVAQMVQNLGLLDFCPAIEILTFGTDRSSRTVCFKIRLLL